MKKFDPDWYNTKMGVTYAAGNLARFNALVNERRIAHHERKEKLTSFIVRGLWYLDQFGQVSPISHPYIWVMDEDGQTRSAPVDIDIAIRKNKVFTRDEWTAWLPPAAQCGYSCGSSLWLPDSNIACACCGKSWGMADSHDVAVMQSRIEVLVPEYTGFTLKYVQELFKARTDAYYWVHPSIQVQHNRFIDMTPDPDYDTLVANESGYIGEGDGNFHPETYLIQDGDKICFEVGHYYHVKCQLETITKKVLQQFTQTIEKCGVEIFGYIRIKNQYGSDSYRGSWFLFDTNMGMLKVGWRKRVITCQIGEMNTSGLGSDYRPVATSFNPIMELEHTYDYEAFGQLLSQYKK